MNLSMMARITVPPPLLLLLMPGVAALALYAPALHFDFVWDDPTYLDRAARLQGWGSLWNWATAPFFGYFRPLALLMMGAEQMVAGGPLVPHLVSLSLFAVNSVLVAILADRLSTELAPLQQSGHSAATGLLAGILYATHPAMVESVAWASSRFDLLVTFFALLALLFDRFIPQSGRRALAVSIALFLALLCKEMALGFILALPVWLWILLPAPVAGESLMGRLRRAGYLPVYAGVAAAVGCFIALHALAVGLPNVQLALAFDESAGQRLLIALKSLGGYLHLAFVPFPSGLPVRPFENPIRVADPEVIGGVAALIALGAMSWRWLRRRPSIHALGLVFALSLLPVLNLLRLPIRDNYMHERYLTLPLVFLCIWAAVAARPLWSGPRSRARLATCLAVTWLAVTAGIVHLVLPNWANNIALWSWAWSRAPESEIALDNLQAALLLDERYTEARQITEWDLRQGRELSALRWLRYGKVLAHLGDSKAAMAAVSRSEALALADDSVGQGEILTTSGWVLLNHGDLVVARDKLRGAVLHDPHSSEAAYYLAIALLALGEVKEGQALLARARSLATPTEAVGQDENVEAFIRTARAAAASAAGK